MTRLHELGVAEIAERVRTRDVSALEVIDDVLQRIEATEPRIRAWVSIDAEGARAQARQADAAAARGDGGPLNGVPVGLKDIYDAVGFSTRCGSTFLPDVPKEKNAASVARLRAPEPSCSGKRSPRPLPTPIRR